MDVVLKLLFRKIIIKIIIFLFITNYIYAQEYDIVPYALIPYYFPNECFYGHNPANATATKVNQHYSSLLSELQEPIIFKEYPNEVYRFTYSVSFVDKNPITIRIEDTENKKVMTFKFIYKKNVYVSNQPLDIFSKTIVIKEKEWVILKNKIDSLNFWEIPSKKTNKDFILSSYSALWILEGRKNNLYHMVHRTSYKDVTQENEIREICLFLLKLSKLKLNKRYFY